MIANITITLIAMYILYSLLKREAIKCEKYEKMVAEEDLFEDDNCYRNRYYNNEE